MSWTKWFSSASWTGTQNENECLEWHWTDSTNGVKPNPLQQYYCRRTDKRMDKRREGEATRIRVMSKTLQTEGEITATKNERRKLPPKKKE